MQGNLCQLIEGQQGRTVRPPSDAYRYAQNLRGIGISDALGFDKGLRSLAETLRKP